MSKDVSKDMSTENTSLYTVVQVSEMLDISKKTVYRYIDKMLSKGVNGVVKGDIDGVKGKYNTKTFVNDIGLAYIIRLSDKGSKIGKSDSVKDSLSAVTDSDSDLTPGQSSDSDLIDFLKEQIKAKDELIKSLTEQNYNNQCLLLNLQNQLLLSQPKTDSDVPSDMVQSSDSDVPKKRHWWKRG